MASNGFPHATYWPTRFGLRPVLLANAVSGAIESGAPFASMPMNFPALGSSSPETLYGLVLDGEGLWLAGGGGGAAAAGAGGWGGRGQHAAAGYRRDQRDSREGQNAGPRDHVAPALGWIRILATTTSWNRPSTKIRKKLYGSMVIMRHRA